MADQSAPSGKAPPSQPPLKMRTVHIEGTEAGEVVIKYTDRDVFVFSPDGARRHAARLIAAAEPAEGHLAQRAVNSGGPYRS